MFGNLLSMQHTTPRASVPTLRVTRKLDAAFAELPASWRVLRNRRANAADGPPWVKYIALHPEKGIALVDLLAANPHAAIAPLDEFLARTGFNAFSRGDPPIVAVALAERDIAAIGDHLADAFAGTRPCGIKNTDWPEAVIELLMSTPGLLLTPLAKASETPKQQRSSRRTDQKASASERPAKSEPSPTPREAPQREPAAPSDSLRPRESNQPREPQAVPLEQPDPELHVGVSRDVERDQLHQYPIGAPDPALRVARPTGLHRESWRPRPFSLWLTAASLCAGAAVGVLYLHSPFTLPDTPARTESAPLQVTDVPGPPADVVAPDKEQHATVLPANPVASPSAPTTPPQPSPTAKPPGPVAASPSLPEARTPEMAATQQAAKAQPAPTAAPAGERKVREARAKLQLNPPRDMIDGDLTPSPTSEETVTIDGTTYVKGREPQALGTVTEPQSDLQSVDVPDN
jgi:hypothetical protein